MLDTVWQLTGQGVIDKCVMDVGEGHAPLVLGRQLDPHPCPAHRGDAPAQLAARLE